MPDRYAVFGHPVSHSKSPLIHAAFARQTAQNLTYEAIEAPLDDFAGCIARFRAAGGAGGNVTVPFKETAFHLANSLTSRALDASAVNTFKFEAGQIVGDNTDGAGLVNDLIANLGCPIKGMRVLLIGAGGAARGVVLPLLEKQPTQLVVYNRTTSKAEALASEFGRKIEGGDKQQTVSWSTYEHLDGRRFDLVINATSASLSGELPPLPGPLFADGALAYDMMYGRDTPFLAFARERGARTADGLGMLVEQAAEAFYVWRGVRPQTAPVIQSLRSS